jgi:ATP-dependent RNA helicase RhlE
MQAFRKGEVRILIATDVAARGLDVSSHTLKTIVNFDFAKDKNNHAHRVGRTGRAGVTQDCIAHTLLTKKQHREAGDLIKVLEESNQTVSKELELLAGKDPEFT